MLKSYSDYDEHKKFGEEIKLLKGILPKEDNTIAISSQLAQLHKLKVGDTLKVGQNDLNKKFRFHFIKDFIDLILINLNITFNQLFTHVYIELFIELVLRLFKILLEINNLLELILLT